MPDLGTGPLMCIRSVACPGCGEGVTQGCMYECEDLIEPSFLMLLILGGCACGQEHPYVVVKGKTHAYCPNCFAPLGDPDAVIRETDEPSSTKRREDEGYGTNPAMPDVKRIKETEDV